MSILSWFSCKKDDAIINNRYIKIIKLDAYHDVTDSKEDEILNLVKFSDFNNKATSGGLQTILSIDHGQYNFLFSNAEFIKDKTPEEALKGILEGIAKDCQETDFSWKNFKITNTISPITWKNYPVAVAEYEVEEHIDYLNTTIQKRIKRYTVFIKKDIWNIVLSPESVKTFDRDMKEFDEMLESLEVK